MFAASVAPVLACRGLPGVERRCRQQQPAGDDQPAQGRDQHRRLLHRHLGKRQLRIAQHRPDELRTNLMSLDPDHDRQPYQQGADHAQPGCHYRGRHRQFATAHPPGQPGQAHCQRDRCQHRLESGYQPDDQAGADPARRSGGGRGRFERHQQHQHGKQCRQKRLDLGRAFGIQAKQRKAHRQCRGDHPGDLSRCNDPAQRGNRARTHSQPQRKGQPHRAPALAEEGGCTDIEGEDAGRLVVPQIGIERGTLAHRPGVVEKKRLIVARPDRP